MPKYRVTITSEKRQYQTFEVEAIDEADAEDLAFSGECEPISSGYKHLDSDSTVEEIENVQTDA